MNNILWQPSKEDISKTNIEHLRKSINNIFGTKLISYTFGERIINSLSFSSFTIVNIIANKKQKGISFVRILDKVRNE